MPDLAIRPALRLVFMGTPEFAAVSLQEIHEAGFQIVGVVTATDKPGGRGRSTMVTSAVKDKALELGLPVLQPHKLKDPEFIDALQKWQADLFVVVAFRMLPEVVWSMPPWGTINLHGSLLPAYRGAAPIHWAVLHGDRETGVSVFFLQHAIDTGDLLYQERMPIGQDETTGSVYQRMMAIGARALIRSLRLIAANDIILRPQDSSRVSHAPKIYPDTAQLDFTWPAGHLANWVRGMAPAPGAWFRLEGKLIKVHRAAWLSERTDQPFGTVVLEEKTLRIAARDGWLLPLELQMEGRRKVGVIDFINGMNWSPGVIGRIEYQSEST